MSMKPLSRQTRDELVATAAELDIPVPEDAVKDEIVRVIEAARSAEPQEQNGDAAGVPQGAPEAAQDADTSDPATGLIEQRRPIETIRGNGDWVDPFSGLRVHRDNKVCTQSGAVRDGDTAVRYVQAEAS